MGLVGFTDSDWAGSVANLKSTSGCCFCLGSAAVSWFSWKQKSVALSSADAEALWLCKLLVNLFGQELRPTMIYCDNQSCV